MSSQLDIFQPFFNKKRSTTFLISTKNHYHLGSHMGFDTKYRIQV